MPIAEGDGAVDFALFAKLLGRPSDAVCRSTAQPVMPDGDEAIDRLGGVSRSSGGRCGGGVGHHDKPGKRPPSEPATLEVSESPNEATGAPTRSSIST